MLPLILALQMTMNMPMGNNPSGRIDVPKGQDRVVIPAIPQRAHHQRIEVAELAASTIAYCKRTKQTRCENEVSAFSGGAKVVVCKVGAAWRVNRCPKP